MNKYALLMLCCAAFSVFADSSIDNSSSTNISAQSNSMQERKKEITLDKTKKEITSKEREKIRSLDLTRQQLKSFSVSKEVPLDALLIPVIRDYEYDLSVIDWSDPKKQQRSIHKALQTCSLYSSVPALATAYPFVKPRLITSLNGHQVIEDGTDYSFVKNKALTYENPTFRDGSMFEASSLAGRRVSTPMIPATCIYLYAEIGKQVIDTLDSFSIGSSKERDGEVALFVDGRLSDVVSRSFNMVMLGFMYGTPVVNAMTLAKADIEKGCLLPTLYGIQNGISDWKCGGLSVNTNDLTATLGGVPLLGGNYYYGKSVSIVSVNGVELAEALSVSKKNSSSIASQKEASKGTTLKKGQSSSTSVVTGVDSASGSGIGSGQ